MLNKKECKELLRIAKPFIKLSCFYDDLGISQPAISKFINSDNRDDFVSKEKLNDLCDFIYNSCCCYRDLYEEALRLYDDGVMTPYQAATTDIVNKFKSELTKNKEKERIILTKKEKNDCLDDLLAREIFEIIGESGKDDSYTFRELVEIILRAYALGKKRGTTTE